MIEEKSDIKKFLIKRIILKRKECALKIIEKLKVFMSKEAKTFHLVKRIIAVRRENAIKIQKNFRGYMARKNAQFYINLTRMCFVIKSGLNEDINDLQMEILTKGKKKRYDFVYDKFYKKFILFLERTHFENDIYKIQFISDGELIIDPQYETCEENGKYYNIINFGKIRKEETKHGNKNISIIKFCCGYLKEKGLSLIPPNYNPETEDIHDIIDIEPVPFKLSSSTEIKIEKKEFAKSRRKLASSTNIRQYNGRLSRRLSKPKGILKESNSKLRKSQRLNNSFSVKRVRFFEEVLFSY